jgi:dTDP-4-dehydrorhamnose reductase
LSLDSEAISESFIVNTLPEELPSGIPLDATVLLKATEKLAAFCQSHNRVLLQMSSASVFDGQKQSTYKESDATHPCTEDGLVILECEHKAVQRCVSTVIIRSSWLFSAEGDNYLSRLSEAAINKREMRFSGAMRSCPTDALSVAKAIVAIAEQVDCRSEPELWGIYHYVDSDGCSMYTFAKTTITVIKSMAEVKIETIEELAAEAGAVSECYELNCKKILSTFGIKQHPWRRGVHDVLKVTFSSSSDSA